MKELAVEEEPRIGKIPWQRDPTCIVRHLGRLNALHEECGEENSSQVNAWQDHLLCKLNIGQLRRECSHEEGIEFVPRKNITVGISDNVAKNTGEHQ